MKLLRRCIDVMQKAGGFEQAIEGWFFGTPLENICKGNMIEWIAWVNITCNPRVFEPMLDCNAPERPFLIGTLPILAKMKGSK